MTPGQVQSAIEAGLGPVGEGAPVFRHWAALAPYLGRNKSLDVAAVALAVQGFACKRLRTALPAVAGIPSDCDVDALDVQPADRIDAGEEALADYLGSTHEEIAATTDPLRRVVLARFEQGSTSPEQVMGAMSEVAESAFTGSLDVVSDVAACLGEDAKDLQSLFEVLSSALGGQTVAAGGLRALQSEPLDVVAAAVAMVEVSFRLSGEAIPGTQLWRAIAGATIGLLPVLALIGRASASFADGGVADQLRDIARTGNTLVEGGPQQLGS